MRSHLTLLIAGLVVLGCSDSGTDPGRRIPSEIRISESSITMDDGATAQLTATVLDRRGQPMGSLPAGLTISWSTSDEGVATVHEGLVTAHRPGQAQISATAGSLSARTDVTVRPLATAVHAAGGDQQQGTVGAPLPIPLSVRVVDRHGGGVAGVQVVFEVTAGGGSISLASATTDADGYIVAAWNLGTVAGENRALARAPGLSGSPVSFSATGTAAAPAELRKIGGDAQEGTTSSTLSDPLAVAVLDRFGNAVGGVAVAWRVVRGGGRITPSAAVSDASGAVTGSWQLGDTIGSQAAAAEITGEPIRAEFTATAEPVDPPRADPVQLQPGMVVGRPTFPMGNTETGGQGQPIGGVSCIDGTIAYHIHPHLSLFVNGEQLAVPAGIGIINPMMSNGYVVGGSCFYWIHTHDASGILHVEPPTAELLTLGQLFAVWGQPLAQDNVAGFSGPVTVYVDGIRYRGDPRAIQLTERRHIALFVGTPLAPIPQYVY